MSAVARWLAAIFAISAMIYGTFEGHYVHAYLLAMAAVGCCAVAGLLDHRGMGERQ